MIPNPAKRSTSGRKREFQLLAHHPKRTQLKKNGRLSHATLSMASDERILRETPILRDLYAFLAKGNA